MTSSVGRIECCFLIISSSGAESAPVQSLLTLACGAGAAALGGEKQNFLLWRRQSTAVIPNPKTNKETNTAAILPSLRSTLVTSPSLLDWRMVNVWIGAAVRTCGWDVAAAVTVVVLINNAAMHNAAIMAMMPIGVGREIRIVVLDPWKWVGGEKSIEFWSVG